MSSSVLVRYSNEGVFLRVLPVASDPGAIDYGITPQFLLRGLAVGKSFAGASRH